MCAIAPLAWLETTGATPSPRTPLCLEGTPLMFETLGRDWLTLGAT